MSTMYNEAQLRESEERYQYLVDVLPDALIVCIDDRIVFANASALRLLHADKPEDMIGLGIQRFIHPDFSDELPIQIRYLVREGGSTNFVQKKLLRLDHAAVDVELRAVAIKYDGKPAVQLIIRDISDRKRMEESLNEKDYLYKSLMESVVAGVFVGQDDNIVYANPYLAEMYGYTVDELLALTPQDLIEPDDVERIKSKVIDGLVHGQKQFPIKCRGRKRDGSTIFMEGNSSIIMLDGRMSLLGTLQDVTFKYEQERKLRDSAKLYQKMIKFVPEPIIVTDQGLIVYANKLAMQMVGACEEAQVVGRSLLDFIHTSQHAQTIEAMVQVMQSDDPTPYQELVLICPNGRFLDVEMSSIRISDYMGKDVMLSVIRDLTERKRSEEVLVRSEKLSAIGQLAAGVAHEIRNPLTALKGFTQLLSAKYPERPHYFEIMANEIDRITLIVNEFMTLAKPHYTQFTTAQLEPILRSVIAILETQAILLNVEITVSLERPLPQVHCSENQLKQVFLNVIKNAIEAMPGGGLVEISACVHKDGSVRIRIKDGGPGISQELIKKIGEPFVTTKEKGTGLGLMISSRIIEAHRGTLGISSKAGEGTVVEITLPVQEQRSRRP
ncbi:PAS domain-containing sensor histidine kinase [Paenibacillus arenilitoris]|uniref:histidine kinase n=1 Tax=Paenibacillus arenilitoris TaxID=2772299 RepID=A0A927CGI7_9BACL|nr:PAS domain-containing sensor histidine kinase [Paenibacillus arenilitoris]MBD2867673.1 PAS domain S-box protein [Paenibacillus arenilitoris]